MRNINLPTPNEDRKLTKDQMIFRHLFMLSQEDTANAEQLYAISELKHAINNTTDHHLGVLVP